MTDTPLGELKLLGRTRSMEAYSDHFMSLSCRDPELMQSQLIELYTASLENPLKTDVALRRPETLNDTVMHAHSYEQRLLFVLVDSGQRN